jgi:hypothetical protein
MLLFEEAVTDFELALTQTLRWVILYNGSLRASNVLYKRKNLLKLQTDVEH